jgi:UDP-3-O-[3-hydroxymyristoyl] glucosamine N-acyltransferase
LQVKPDGRFYKVGKNCKFAGQVGLAGHLTIGDNVQIGAQSGVSKSIKDNEIVLSSPAVNYKDAIKTYTIIRNLPKLRGRSYTTSKRC